jgi:4-hydroxy-3-methylbut-2-enyl diphosphate reductase
MTRPVICAPLGIERLALRRAATPVVRTGMGPARSRRSAMSGRPVLVAGVGGGVAPGVRAGDVVVATAVIGPDGGGRPCTATSQLADDLRRLGFAVHLGPIVSVARVADGADRRALAATGALAVDTESSWLAPGDGSPYAVVRVITDTEEQPLLRPGIVVRGARALGVLRRCVPALDAWASATEPPGTPESLCSTLPKEVS